ncbi:MAG: inositol monophosphatase [Pseudonocardiaceae bacterium]|nr:inositol monophosphatase [Pseudonocardiaceae bacterium]
MNDADARRLLAVAKTATSAASELVRSRPPRTLTWKGDRDVTSDVDMSVENLIRNYLHRHTPGAGFLGEEEGGSNLGDGSYWILDPIDGTINFLHGLPLCAISLSLVHNGVAVVAVIDLPFLSAQYSALKDHGSFVNDVQLAVSSTHSLDAALISVDQYTFGEHEHKNRLRHTLAERLAAHAQRIRMLGTSAIDLAWTAQGRLDACVLLGNKPWDTSAGVLIAQEAGARLLDLDGTDHSTDSVATIAVTPPLEDALMAVIREAVTATAVSG